MTTIAELRIPATEFALKETFEACPDVRIEVLQGVAHDSPGLSNLVWLETEDPEAAHRAIEGDGTVGAVSNLGQVGDRWLYDVEWKAPVTVTVAVLLEDATMLGATGAEGNWSFRVLFPDRSALSIASTVFEEYDIDLRIERIYELGGSGEHGEYDLTDAQWEALEAALEAGYFEIPREATLGTLSDDLDISHQALSERLRRANEILAEAAIGPSASTDGELEREGPEIDD
jgi:hypothetical protein